MKYGAKLLLTYLFFSVLSFSVIGILVNQAIDYFGFVTIEKQMIEKADICELSFREVLTRHEKSPSLGQSASLVADVLEVLKASGKEVRIYDNRQKLLGLAVNGIIINDGDPRIFTGNISNALKGNYAYTVTNNRLIYFAIPIQDMYYQHPYVFEIVENISYFYEIMDQIRYILLIGAGGFILLITLSSLYIARKTTKPIHYLLAATEKFSRQQFDPVVLNRKDELGMLAAGLNRMGIELHNDIQHQKQFISNVSHELKTPLAAISGFSQYLCGEENADEEQKKIYAHLLEESNRLTKLIQELLILSRFDKATQDIETEKVDVSELSRRVMLEMKPKADKKGISVEMNVGNPIFAEVNEVLMAHAISNVLDNAVKYSNTGGHVTIAISTAHEAAVVKISDRGIGIHSNDLPFVQKRFFRAGNSNVATGSGLGLSLCREIVEKCNGRLIVESEMDVGTTVTILLPLA